jgi:hypothetical protein
MVSKMFSHNFIVLENRDSIFLKLLSNNEMGFHPFGLVFALKSIKPIPNNPNAGINTRNPTCRAA